MYGAGPPLPHQDPGKAFGHLDYIGFLEYKLKGPNFLLVLIVTTAKSLLADSVL